MGVSDLIYLPQAKWKAGERRAFNSCAALRDGRLAPIFKITPAGGYDPDQQRVLTTAEYLHSFGAQLAASCGRRLAFIDVELIDDERHANAVGVHPLTELLVRSRLAGANASPVFSTSSSPEHKAAVRAHYANGSQPTGCFKVGLHELETLRSAEDLIGYAEDFGASPASTLLLIDGGPLAIVESEEFAHLLATQLSRLVAPDRWAKVFWSATSFPDGPKLKAGEIGVFPRLDWTLFKYIRQNAAEFPVEIGFSDYMLEYPSQYNPVNVRATAKLSYSTKDDYIISKGRSTKVDSGYKNIFPVAKNLISHPGFMGEAYSLGDEYMARLASGTGRTGTASLWKWCATDHHLALVYNQLREMLAMPINIFEPVEPAEQLELL